MCAMHVLYQTIYKNQFGNLSYRIEERIDISNFTKGVYFIKVISKSIMKIDKLIIQ